MTSVAHQRPLNDYSPRGSHERGRTPKTVGPEKTRQIRGAALAGSVAGAVMAGPMGAVAVGSVVVAAGAAFATAKERDGGVGNAARSVEKAAQDTGRAIKRSSSFKAIQNASSNFKFSDDSLEAEVRRREAQMQINENQNRPKTKMRRGHRIRKLTGSIAKRLRRKHKNLEAQRNRSESAASEEGGDNQISPRLTNGPATTRESASRSKPTRSRSWLGRKSASNDEDALASVDAYVAQANLDPKNRVGELKGGSRHGTSSSINKAPSQALDRLESERSSLLYRIVKKTIQPYALSQDETRAVAHHVAYTVLATLNHSPPVTALKESSMGISVKDNYITKMELKLIATHITHEVEAAVDKNESINENALSDCEVMALARHIVRQVCMCVSNCTTIQEHQLSVPEMQSLAWFMKDQFKAQAYSALALTAKELRSLAYYLKLQAHQGLDNSTSTALDSDKIARDMEELITTMEEEAECCDTSVASKSREESKEDYYSDEESTDYSDSDGSYTDDYTDSEAEGEWVDDYKGSPRKAPTYDFETSLSARKNAPAGHKSCLPRTRSMGDDSASTCDVDDRSVATSYDSRDGDSQIYDTDGSFDSRYDDHSESTCSYHSRKKKRKDKKKRDRRRDRQSKKGNKHKQIELDLKNKEEKPKPKKNDDASDSSAYEESVCGDVDWAKEEEKTGGRPGGHQVSKASNQHKRIELDLKNKEEEPKDDDASDSSAYEESVCGDVDWTKEEEKTDGQHRNHEASKLSNNNLKHKQIVLDLKNKEKETNDDASDSSAYEESVCGDVDWTKEQAKEDGYSSDTFEDAVFEDAVQEGGEEEKKEDAGTDYPDMEDFEEASELALQIIEKMIFTP